MDKPIIQRFPTEIFGQPFTNNSKTAIEIISKQFCPYLKSECKKPRKSEPHIKVGVCSIGYKGFLSDYEPIIICPHRLNEEIVFRTIRHFYFPKWQSFSIVQEVSMGVGGSIDFVAVNHSERGLIDDFLCIEFQAGGTTGTPWQAVLDFKKHGRFLQTSYPYGINWANEFMKTMMQQVYKKGKIIETWKRKMIFVVQDVAIEYLRKAVDVSGLRDARQEDSIHFCSFKMNWVGDKWELKFSERLSTDVEGINKILGGAGMNEYLTIENFKDNILRKGISDGIYQNKVKGQLSILF